MSRRDAWTRGTAWVVAALVCASSPRPVRAREPVAAPSAVDLAPIVAAVREARGVPGIVAVLVGPDGTRATAAAGVRRHRPRDAGPAPAVAAADDPLRVGDVVGFGISTPVTALVAASLVADGTVAWDAPLRALVAAEAGDPVWGEVSVRRLLAKHVGRALKIPPAVLADPEGAPIPSPTETRRALFRHVVARPFERCPDDFDGANAPAVALAAYVLERAAGTPYETLARARVFDPLGMATATYGPVAADAGRTDAPGHREDLTVVEVRPRTAADRAFAGAIGLRASIDDIGRLLGYALLLTTGGGDAPVEARATVTAEPSLPLSVGWRIERRPWGRGDVLYRSGSASGWTWHAYVVPRRGFALGVAANVEGGRGDDACFDVLTAVSGAAERPVPAR